MEVCSVLSCVEVNGCCLVYTVLNLLLLCKGTQDRMVVGPFGLAYRIVCNTLHMV